MLLDIKQVLEDLYTKYDTWLYAIGKFVLALVCFFTIRGKLGQMEVLNDVILLIVLSLAASFLPLNAIVFFGTAMILGHLYALSVPAVVVGGGILLILLLLYFGLAPGHALALILMPLALALRIPLAIPLAFGLLSNPLSGLGMAVGTVGYFGLQTILKVQGGQETIEPGAGLLPAQDVMTKQIQELLDALVGNGEMILMLIAILATLIIVFAVRRMEMKYAWQMAVGTGSFIFLTVDLLGIFMLDLSFSVLSLIVGTLVSILAGILLQVFFFHLDYRHTEKLQFEDDDYYYYVKAVPKRKQERTVDEWTH